MVEWLAIKRLQLTSKRCHQELLAPLDNSTGSNQGRNHFATCKDSRKQHDKATEPRARGSCPETCIRRAPQEVRMSHDFSLAPSPSSRKRVSKLSTCEETAHKFFIWRFDSSRVMILSNLPQALQNITAVGKIWHNMRQ